MKCTKPYTVTSSNPKMGGSTAATKGYKDGGYVKGYKDGGYVMKPEDYVDNEAKDAAKNKARNEQIKADAEMMKKKYPEKKGK
jgi:hypothetical protein